MDQEYHFISSKRESDKDSMASSEFKTYQTISQDGNYCIEQVDAVKNRLDNRKKELVLILVLVILLILGIVLLLLFTGFFINTYSNSGKDVFSEQVNPSNHEPTNDYSVIVVEKIGEPFGFQISYNLERRPGVSINKIVEGGPADQAGLISGDHILSINDIELNSLVDVQTSLIKKKSEGQIDIVFLRGSDVYEITLLIDSIDNQE